MASRQGIKRRIKSVTSTKQITKAMQLVAASKLRRAQEAVAYPKLYVEAAQEILNSFASTPEAQYHPLFASRSVKNVLTIAVAGDRGLAGAYNSNILRTIKKHAVEVNARQHYVIAIGNYLAGSVAHHIQNVEELAAYPIDVADSDVMVAQPALGEAFELFETGKVDAVFVIYTDYTSAIKQQVVTKQLLPLQIKANTASARRTYEPSGAEVLNKTAIRLLEAQLLQAVLAAAASEQAARMLAMKNATDNASDLIEDLVLAFNNARQAAITQELAEISAGAEALNG